MTRPDTTPIEARDAAGRPGEWCIRSRLRATPTAAGGAPTRQASRTRRKRPLSPSWRCQTVFVMFVSRQRSGLPPSDTWAFGRVDDYSRCNSAGGLAGLRPDLQMQRRKMLKVAAGSIGAGAVGAGALFASGARAADSFTISDSSATTDDGQILYVQVDTNHRVVWNGFDVDVAAVAYTDEIVHEASGTSDVIYDNTASPVRLADFSSEGDGSDGWGGPGEYASEATDSYVAATGPTDQGYVNADISWRPLDEGGDDANSVEDPAPLGDYPVESDTDGETSSTTLTYRKTVSFYKDDGSGNLVQMGAEDGTLAEAVSEAQFTVDVTNQESTNDVSGSGSSSVGT